jgi:hypothetical protein
VCQSFVHEGWGVSGDGKGCDGGCWQASWALGRILLVTRGVERSVKHPCWGEGWVGSGAVWCSKPVYEAR